MKDYAKIFETIVDNTQIYLERANLKSMVLGISGGIDSTVVAAVCHEVHKRNPDIKFIGVSLPCLSNSVTENESAHYVSKAFCDTVMHSNIEDTYLNIQNLCDTYCESTAISRGNIKARLRMIYLYNVAGINNGVVMDTDNLTEHYLGFFTIHGDQGDLNPIGQLWKTEVYELAKYLKNEYYKDTDNDYIIKALEHAINITPTDGNGVKNGGDLEQIMPGYTYADVDKILQFVVKIFPTPQMIHEFLEENDHITSEAFWKVVHRFERSNYKRKQLPIVIDIE